MSATQLIRYDQARYALALARDVDEVKDIKDKAEALRLYARQAHDKDLELWTAEIQLRAVRKIGELSADLDKRPNASELLNGEKFKTQALADAGITVPTAHRYERVAAIDEAEIEAYIAAKRGMSEPVSVSELLLPAHHRTQFTGENEWYTPLEYVEAARAAMGGIDLDAASSEQAQQQIRAARFFSIDHDALTQPWAGRVWLNPPFAQPLIQRFVEKLVSEYSTGHLTAAVLLTHNYTDTAWFHLAASKAEKICFTRGRVKFVDRDGMIAAPTQGQAFFYFGHQAAKFCRSFLAYGFIR